MADTKYHQVATTDEEIASSNSNSRHDNHKHMKNVVLWAVIAFCCGVLLSTLSLRSFPWYIRDKLAFLRTSGDVQVQFAMNMTFPGPPTMESEWAWLDLLPDGLGSVQHDGLGDEIYTIAVFHQLHCLMVLRHAAYDSWNETKHVHMGKNHIEHCIDYLRQSIICHADTSLETRTLSDKGRIQTLGWDLKQCRDYSRVKEWAEDWRVFDGKIPSTKKKVVDRHGRNIRYHESEHVYDL